MFSFNLLYISLNHDNINISVLLKIYYIALVNLWFTLSADRCIRFLMIELYSCWKHRVPLLQTALRAVFYRGLFLHFNLQFRFFGLVKFRDISLKILQYKERPLLVLTLAL